MVVKQQVKCLIGTLSLGHEYHHFIQIFCMEIGVSVIKKVLKIFKTSTEWVNASFDITGQITKATT